MGSVNRHFLTGKLVNNPIVKETTDGRKYCDFTVETIESYKDKAGEKKQNKTWHLVRLWGRPVELALQHLRKGKIVTIDGKVSNMTYEDKMGDKHTCTYTTGAVILQDGEIGD